MEPRIAQALAQALETEEGRVALAQAMVEPISNRLMQTKCDICGKVANIVMVPDSVNMKLYRELLQSETWNPEYDDVLMCDDCEALFID